MNERLLEKVSRLPTGPGVYIMRDARGAVLYIGKATNLRSRVRSYFGGHDPRPFVRLLDTLLDDVEVVLSLNPKEALLLENTLIKQHRPRFNFMLRDDKNYLSLRIDTRHAWPRVELVRRLADDGARYFGPYHSAQSVRQTLSILNRFFGLRTCPDSVLHNRTRPCLQYQIRRCPAPCVLPLDRDAYLDDVQRAIWFLEGRSTPLLAALRQRMDQAADQLEFEQAAALRDQIQAIEASLTRQSAVRTALEDVDVIGMIREAEAAALVVLLFRGGHLMDVAHFGLTDQVLPDPELLTAFLSQYYTLEGRAVPPEIIVPLPPAEAEGLEEALGDLRGRRVHLVVPRRGERVDLLEMARTNARSWWTEHMSTQARHTAAVERLGQRLGLAQLPRVMECYDISNFQGTHIVASQVVFVDGQPDRSRYRRYRIRSTAGQDDFAAMFEVLSRRARQALEGQTPMPDLILIDGGKGQLNMAIQALHDLGLHDQDILSLAKSRTLEADADQPDTVRVTPERIFLPGHRDPIVLRQNSEEVHLLTRIRDEAHRVAITYHRELRSRSTLRSRVDDIPGIGPQRRALLLQHFGSVKKLRQASLADIEATPGLPRNLALRIYASLHPDLAPGLPPAADDGVHAAHPDPALDPPAADEVPVLTLDEEESESTGGTPEPPPPARTRLAGKPDAADDLQARLGTTRVIAAGSRRPRRKGQRPK